MVVAQEEEVRSIADEHLEREASLIKLLEDLYGKQRVGFVVAILKQTLDPRNAGWSLGRGIFRVYRCIYAP